MASLRPCIRTINIHLSIEGHDEHGVREASEKRHMDVGGGGWGGGGGGGGGGGEEFACDVSW